MFLYRTLFIEKNSKQSKNDHDHQTLLKRTTSKTKDN